MSGGLKAAVLVSALALGVVIGRGTTAKPRRGDHDPAKVFVVTAVTIDGKRAVVEEAKFQPDPLPGVKNGPESWRYDLDGGRVVLEAMRIDRAMFRHAGPPDGGGMVERPAPAVGTAAIE